jgi:guanyl-specific ribonuclease Sa
VFDNREKLLPQRPTGYYHEYTVPTPGSADRGPRRLITGDGHELYYTGDHYQTFASVDPTK